MNNIFVKRQQKPQSSRGGANCQNGSDFANRTSAVSGDGYCDNGACTSASASAISILCTIFSYLGLQLGTFDIRGAGLVWKRGDGVLGLSHGRSGHGMVAKKSTTTIAATTIAETPFWPGCLIQT